MENYGKREGKANDGTNETIQEYQNKYLLTHFIGISKHIYSSRLKKPQRTTRRWG